MNPKKSLILILLIVGSLLVLYFFVLPGWGKLSDKKTRLIQVEKQRQDSLNTQANLENFLKEFDSYTTESATMDKALPLREPLIAQVLNGLDEFGKASGLLLSELTFVEAGEDQKKLATVNSISSLEVNFSASGSYESFKNFFLRIEHSLRIMDIQDVSFTVEEESGDIKAQIKFITYYQN